MTRFISIQEGEEPTSRRGRMAHLAQGVDFASDIPEPEWPILICLLGNFSVLKMGQPVAVNGGKAEGLLYNLALRHPGCVRREVLLDILWPDSECTVAGQSLNSLVYSLHKLLGDAIGDAPPVLHRGGCYRFNAEAGMGVDVECFDTLAKAGDQEARAGNRVKAITSYSCAVRLYRGDLSVGTDIHATV